MEEKNQEEHLGQLVSHLLGQSKEWPVIVILHFRFEEARPGAWPFTRERDQLVSSMVMRH